MEGFNILWSKMVSNFNFLTTFFYCLSKVHCTKNE